MNKTSPHSANAALGKILSKLYLKRNELVAFKILKTVLFIKVFNEYR